jgi:hypothetical protein
LCIRNLHQKAQFYQGRGDDADILMGWTAPAPGIDMPQRGRL